MTTRGIPRVVIDIHEPAENRSSPDPRAFAQPPLGPGVDCPGLRGPAALGRRQQLRMGNVRPDRDDEVVAAHVRLRHCSAGAETLRNDRRARLRRFHDRILIGAGDPPELISTSTKSREPLDRYQSPDSYCTSETPRPSKRRGAPEPMEIRKAWSSSASASSVTVPNRVSTRGWSIPAAARPLRSRNTIAAGNSADREGIRPGPPPRRR